MGSRYEDDVFYFYLSFFYFYYPVFEQKSVFNLRYVLQIHNFFGIFFFFVTFYYNFFAHFTIFFLIFPYLFFQSRLREERYRHSAEESNNNLNILENRIKELEKNSKNQQEIMREKIQKLEEVIFLFIFIIDLFFILLSTLHCVTLYHIKSTYYLIVFTTTMKFSFFSLFKSDYFSPRKILSHRK